MSKERIYLNMLLNKASLTDEEKRLLVNYLSKNDTPKLRQLLFEKIAMNSQHICKTIQEKRVYLNLRQKNVAEMAGVRIFGKQCW